MLCKNSAQACHFSKLKKAAVLVDFSIFRLYLPLYALYAYYILENQCTGMHAHFFGGLQNNIQDFLCAEQKYHRIIKPFE